MTAWDPLGCNCWAPGLENGVLPHRSHDNRDVHCSDRWQPLHCEAHGVGPHPVLTGQGLVRPRFTVVRVLMWVAVTACGWVLTSNHSINADSCVRLDGHMCNVLNWFRTLKRGYQCCEGCPPVVSFLYHCIMFAVPSTLPVAAPHVTHMTRQGKARYQTRKFTAESAVWMHYTPSVDANGA